LAFTFRIGILALDPAPSDGGQLSFGVRPLIANLSLSVSTFMFYSSIWDGALKLLTFVVTIVTCMRAAKGQSDLVMTLAAVASIPIWCFV
jgi:hypothetical protein